MKESAVGGMLHRCGRVGLAVNRSGIVCPLGLTTLEGVNTAANGLSMFLVGSGVS